MQYIMNPTNNITVLQNEMDWLSAVIEQVLKSYFMQEGHEQNWLEIPCPDLNDSDSAYAQAIKCWDLNIYARLGLALAIAPHFRPEVLDVFFTKNQLYDRGFSEFGGVRTSNHSGFLPTGQTLCFLLGSVHSALRTEAMEILSSNHILRKEDVLLVSETEPGAPILNATLGLNNKWYQYFVSGKEIPDETFPLQQQAGSSMNESLDKDSKMIRNPNDRKATRPSLLLQSVISRPSVEAKFVIVL
jgi:hypothetical protein